MALLEHRPPRRGIAQFPAHVDDPRVVGQPVECFERYQQWRHRAQVAPFLAASPRAIFSGVSGSSSRRRPVASSIALAIAAGAGTIGGSPTPRAPNGPSGAGTSTMIVSMLGRSAAVSLR